jgi:hypothetical protein
VSGPDIQRTGSKNGTLFPKSNASKGGVWINVVTLDKYELQVEHLEAVSMVKLSTQACKEGPPEMIISQLKVEDGL